VVTTIGETDRHRKEQNKMLKWLLKSRLFMMMSALVLAQNESRKD
jgi:hypothetical protein